MQSWCDDTPGDQHLPSWHSRVLIDAGDEHTSAEYTKLLKSVLEEEKTTISHLLITHWHHDHIGGAKDVQNLIKSSSNTAPAVWKLPRSPEDQQPEEYPVELNLLEDEQSFEVEGAKLTVKHTPGHTTDHVCLVLQEENVLFSGDCILGETTAVFEDLKDYLTSLDKILGLKNSVIYPGHGPVVEDPTPKILYYIEHRRKREEAIVQVLKNTDKSLDEMEIVGFIYQETPKDLWPAAAVNVKHHLQKLLKEERVSTGRDNKWTIAS
ncbi:beta-lactamase-like protein 2 homolog isoform X2 [Fopius arisanus]|uniref:Beta-lactamase-like protein 2 homolog isoform X2 n=1 Tax=Fopius arisanus TaxID=64838 RepID=A0A9R1TV67_9HYME|nr:PREDICTED: beta-lactamase-like protein 2 homolog isoform X2 [Fopius arisanus]